jgi:hypothetical protein
MKRRFLNVIARSKVPFGTVCARRLVRTLFEETILCLVVRWKLCFLEQFRQFGCGSLALHLNLLVRFDYGIRHGSLRVW